MEFVRLLEECEIETATWLRAIDRHAEIETFLPADCDDAPELGILYVGPLERLPSPQFGISCLCTGPLPNDSQLQAWEGANLVWTASPSDYVIRRISECLARQYRYQSACGELVGALSTGRGLQHLLDCAYRVLGNPMIVVDTSYKILAINTDLTLQRADLARQKDIGYMLDANIQAMKQVQLYEHARQFHYPYYRKDPEAAHGWIIALVYSDGIEVAQIGVMDCNRPFHRYDFELVQFLCRLVALDLQKNDFYGTNVNLQHSVLLADLLNGNVTDGETATVRSTQLGWVLSSSMYIVTIFDQNFGVFDRKARLVSEALHPLLPNSRWVIYDNKIVYFVSYPTDIYAEDVLDSGLMEYLSKNRLTAAISGRFQTLLELRQAYQQSLAAFELGCRISPGQTIYWYRDCLPYHIGELLSRQAPLRSFCHPGVLRLAEYDRANQTQYLTTLASYLNHAAPPLRRRRNCLSIKTHCFTGSGKSRNGLAYGWRRAANGCGSSSHWLSCGCSENTKKRRSQWTASQPVEKVQQKLGFFI